MNGAELAKQFTRNTRFLTGRLEGITHEQSLIQPDFGANCLNWTVGHIVEYRSNVAALAGIEVPPSESLERYAQESDPITSDGPGVVAFDVLLERLVSVDSTLDAGLSALTAEQLSESIERNERTLTRLSRILFLYFHDTLHTGQADVLAELARHS